MQIDAGAEGWDVQVAEPGRFREMPAGFYSAVRFPFSPAYVLLRSGLHFKDKANGRPI